MCEAEHCELYVEVLTDSILVDDFGVHVIWTKHHNEDGASFSNFLLEPATVPILSKWLFKE